MFTTQLIDDDGWVYLPVYGTVVAGKPEENYIIEDTYEAVSPEMLTKGDCFAAKILGDSMEPEMAEGDIVIVRSQNDCKNGELAIVSVDGSRATVKRVNKDTRQCRLESVNGSYQPQIYKLSQKPEHDIKIMGVVIELRKKYGKSRYAK